MASLKRYDKSHWLQERERFRLTRAARPPAQSDNYIRQTILDIFSKMNTGERSIWRQLEQEWVDLVGNTIARHARPVRLDRKNLIVAVDSSVWLNELIRYERQAMLAKIQQRLGQDQVQSIRFQVDPQAVLKKDPLA